MKVPGLDKGFPRNWETERSLLGGLLLDGSMLGEVRELVTAEDFHRPHHAALFRVLCEMGDATDPTTVLDEIVRRDALESVGGASYLLALPAACPSVDSVPAYAARVQDHSARRKVLLAHLRGVERVQAGEADTAALIEEGTRELLGIAHGAGAKEYARPSEIVDERLLHWQRACENPGAITGVPTGLHDLDRRLVGLHPADLVVIAGRPASGKTGLCLNIAAHAAKTGTTVAFFSLEMSRESLVDRLVIAEARVDAQRVRLGELSPHDDWPRLTRAAEVVHALPILIDDTPGLTVSRLRRKARRMRAENPSLGLIVIDYIQLMEGEGRRDANRTEVVGAISRGLKLLAKDLDVPVVVLSQLNRSLESRSDKRPIPSDLRDSGAIEADADVILFIYRDEVYNPESPDKGIAELIVSKQRAGPIGTVKVAFLAQFLLFQNLASQPWAPEPGHGGGGYY